MRIIEVSEAKSIILKTVSPLPPKITELEKSVGFFLAENVTAPVSHPLFNQSAVDGYCFRLNRKEKKNTLKVISEIQPGENIKIRVGKNEALRVYTGAKIPEPANTVVMQENVLRVEDTLSIIKNGLHPWSNIRKKGDQIKKGDIALRKGSELNPASIGFLSSLGISKVKTIGKPEVTVIVTGNEIASSPDSKINTKKIADGKIFDANGIMLKALLAQMQIAAEIIYCKDNALALERIIRQAEKKSNLLIITGGVSVGGYDFTSTALQKNNYRILFHGVNQKPGKPLLFAKNKNCFALGLPGNPRASLICFYEYAFPVIRIMAGASSPFLKNIFLPLSNTYEKKNDGKTHFVSGKIINGKLLIYGKQNSHILQSFAEAEVIAVLPNDTLNYAEGEVIMASILP